MLSVTPSGTLSVDVDAVKELGVEMSFWITVSLAFLEFLRDRDVSGRVLWEIDLTSFLGVSCCSGRIGFLDVQAL